MNGDLCQLLDDHLTGTLRREDASRFAEHLLQCEDCRQAVAMQAELDRLLCDGADEQPGAMLLARIERQIRLSRRRRWLVTSSMTAAAVLLVATAAVVWQAGERPEGNVRSVVQQPPVEPQGQIVDSDTPKTGETDVEPPVEPRSPVIVQFASESRVIGKPIPTQSPNVSIVWVYPEYVSHDEQEPTEAPPLP
ncbi:MAG: zf-HC2 domain-containing protein [Pirellulales bacterium]